MTEVVDLCSSDDDDADDADDAAGEKHAVSKTCFQPSKQHVQSPAQRSLSSAAKMPIHSHRAQSSGLLPTLARPIHLTDGPARPDVDLQIRAKEGASSSSRPVVSKHPPTRPGRQLSLGKWPSTKSPATRTEFEQHSSHSSTATPADVTRGNGLTGFRKPRLLSSDTISPSAPPANPERGQKRAPSDKPPLSSGYRPLKKLKEMQPTHPLASALSSKARYGRSKKSVPAAGSKMSSVIDLTVDEDEDERSATATFNEHHEHWSQTTAAPSFQPVSTPARYGGEVNRAGQCSQSCQAPKWRASPKKATHDLQTTVLPPGPLLAQTSVRSSVENSGRSGHNNQHSGEGQTDGSARGFVSGTTTNRQAQITGKDILLMKGTSVSSKDRCTERRATIPESPPLSPTTTRKLQSQSPPHVTRDIAGVPQPNSAPVALSQHDGPMVEEDSSSGARTRHEDISAIAMGIEEPASSTIAAQPETAKHVDRDSDEDTTYGSMKSSVPHVTILPRLTHAPKKDARPLPSDSNKSGQPDKTTTGLNALLQVDASEQAERVDTTVRSSNSHVPKLSSTRTSSPSAASSTLPCGLTSSKLTEPGSIASNDCDTGSLDPIESDTIDMRSASAFGARSIERLVGQYAEESRNDNEHWARIELQRARTKAVQRFRSTMSSRTTSVFSSLTPLALRPSGKGAVPEGCTRFVSEVHTVATKPAKSSWYAKYTRYDTSSDTVEVPRYSHYVSINQNLLANNVTSLQHWPYFGDDFDISKAYALNKEYYVDVDSRERKLLRLGQAESFAPYADDLVTSAGVECADILRFMLEIKPDVGSNPDALKALRDRENFISEDFIRDGERWGEVLAKLPAPLPDRTGRAAILCDQFHQIFNFPFWHVVRRSSYTKQLVAQVGGLTDEEQLTCRVCMQFSCPYHGEIRDHQDRSKDASDADDETVETDIILPQIVNFRARVTIPETVDSEPAIPDKRRTLDYWEKGPFGNLKWKADERGPFYPCNHPGVSCSDARCSCFDARIACEKTCSCGPGCKRKWKGCLCNSGKRQKGKFVCWEDDRCACFQRGRECDPDLCGDCGVADVLDPVHRHDDRILSNRCRMASMQRGVPKHTILGDSGVHGLGLYACEDIRQDDFVGEYKGETITKDEAERRGAVYEHQKLSYLFTLNSKQEIDSTYFGNKVRFINHAHGSKSNLKPLIIMVNSVFRIGLYAKKKIRTGEEFFFDYGPSFPKEQLGGKAVKPTNFSKSAPHVRNAGHVRDDFYDIDISLDQLGNLRATKAVGSSSSDNDQESRQVGDLNAPHQKRAGARNGAGRPRKPRHRGEENVAAEQHSDEQYGHMNAQQRLTMYNVLESSADDEDFEPEEDSMSEADLESESE